MLLTITEYLKAQTAAPDFSWEQEHVKIEYFMTISECIGKYAALIYLNEIKEFQLLDLCISDLKRLVKTCKQATLYAPELDFVDSAHLCGYAAATLLFKMHGDAKLADASRAISFDCIEHAISGYTSNNNKP